MSTDLMVLTAAVLVVGLVMLALLICIFLRGATKADVQRLEDKVNALDEEVESKFETERATARESLGKVHSRIDQEVVKVAEMKGAFDEVKKSLTRVESKIDQLFNKS